MLKLSGKTPARLLGILAFVVMAWVAFAFSFTPLRTSHDEFWHLKTGQWISDHGYLPENDIFTYTAEKIPWHNHEWLTQVLMWQIYQLGERAAFGGLRAVILFKSLVIVLAFAGFGLLLARRMRQPVWAALAAAMAVALARRTFYPRPPFVTYLILVLIFWMLIEWRAGRLRACWLWLFAPLFALWANLHGGWAAGLVVIGAFWADAVWSLSRTKFFGSPLGPQLRRLAFLSLLGAACLLATLATPYGYRLYDMFGNVMNDKYLFSSIGEMRPPDWNFVWVLEGVILTLAAAAIRPVRVRGFLLTAVLLAVLHYALRLPLDPRVGQYFATTLQSNPSGWKHPACALGAWITTHPAWIHTAIALPVFTVAILRQRVSGRLAHLLLVCFFSYQAIHHVRHLPLMAVMILPVLAWSLESWARQGAVHWTSSSLMRARAPTAAIGLLALFLLTAHWISGYWISADWQLFRREGPSYLQRNIMLARGIEMQPVATDTRTIQWLLPTGLPRGIYLIAPYPVAATDFLLRARLPRPLWNGGNYAGYLIWRLAPERYKLFTDNRYDIYGGKFIRQEHSVLNGWDAEGLKASGLTREAGFYPWNEVLDRWNVQTIFIPNDARVNPLLARGNAWVRVWEDYEFNIWVRNTPANQAVIQNALAIPRKLPVLARISR